MRVRKPAYEMVAEDFEKFPVWEYALDEEGEAGQDESTMRPVVESGPIDTVKRQVFVRAQFALADGTICPGCLTLLVLERQEWRRSSP